MIEGPSNFGDGSFGAPTPIVSRALRAIESGEVPAARDAIQAFAKQQTDLLISYFEWAEHWRASLHRRLGHGAVLELRVVRRRWHKNVSVFAPKGVRRQTDSIIHSVAQRSVLKAPPLLARSFALAEQETLRCSSTRAIRAFETAVCVARAFHDVLVEYVAGLAEAAFACCGPLVASEDALSSLASCSYYVPAWDALVGATPVEVARAILHEFEGHLSGPTRLGEVRIEEDEKSYRIILDPCGSGGALRRRREAAGRRSPAIAPALGITWSIGGAVPPYCSHCAQNELTSLSKSGRLLWTTSFDPDPARPCGWVVFKEPSAAPRHLIARLRPRNFDYEESE